MTLTAHSATLRRATFLSWVVLLWKMYCTWRGRSRKIHLLPLCIHLSGTTLVCLSFLCGGLHKTAALEEDAGKLHLLPLSLYPSLWYYSGLPSFLLWRTSQKCCFNRRCRKTALASTLSVYLSLWCYSGFFLNPYAADG